MKYVEHFHSSVTSNSKGKIGRDELFYVHLHTYYIICLLSVREVHVALLKTRLNKYRISKDFCKRHMRNDVIESPYPIPSKSQRWR